MIVIIENLLNRVALNGIIMTHRIGQVVDLFAILFMGRARRGLAWLGLLAERRGLNSGKLSWESSWITPRFVMDLKY